VTAACGGPCQREASWPRREEEIEHGLAHGRADVEEALGVAKEVAAAGRLDPRKAYTDPLAELRPKDGLCVGMLPMNAPDQIAENAALVAELSAGRP